MLSGMLVVALVVQAPRPVDPATSPARHEAKASTPITDHDRQLEIMARIKAEREAKQGGPATAPRAATPRSPGDMGFRERLRAKKAGYRAFQARQNAAEAAQIKAMKEEQLRLMPYMLELNRQQTAAATARYQADQRLRGDKAIANGLKGVTAPPY